MQACRYTLLVASSAARVDQWAQFAGLLAERLGIEEGKPGLLLVARDFVPGSERARELLPLRQRCLVCLDCSDPERTPAALAMLAAQLAVTTTEAPPTERWQATSASPTANAAGSTPCSPATPMRASPRSPSRCKCWRAGS